MTPNPESDGRPEPAWANTPVAIGNIETPIPQGWTRVPLLEDQLRRNLAGHCAGHGRRRQCPQWYGMMVDHNLEVIRGPNGELAARVATMVPQRGALGAQLGTDMCAATRLGLEAVGAVSGPEVTVFQWDGRSELAGSHQGQVCQ